MAGAARHSPRPKLEEARTGIDKGGDQVRSTVIAALAYCAETSKFSTIIPVWTERTLWD